MVELQQGMTLLAFGEKTGVGTYRVSRISSAPLNGRALLNVVVLIRPQRLYDPSRWNSVRDQFRETFLTLYALPSQPLLSLALSAGLSSLRLPSCAKHSIAGDSNTNTSAAFRSAAAKPPTMDEASALEIIKRATDVAAAVPAGTDPNGNSKGEGGSSGNADCPTCGEYVRVLAKELPMSHHVNSTIVCRISGQVMDSENEPMAFPNGYVYSSKVSTTSDSSAIVSALLSLHQLPALQRCGGASRLTRLGAHRDGQQQL